MKKLSTSNIIHIASTVVINEQSLKDSNKKEVIDEDDAKLNNYFEYANKSKTPKSSMETPTTDDWYVFTIKLFIVISFCRSL